jgi:hypothetical protein
MSNLPPSITSYLERLPAGVRSYPECLVKASVFRNALAVKPLGPEVALPEEVRALVDHPPPVSVWIPEVQFNVIILALRDAHFGADDLAGYLAWALDQNRRLLGTPLYRALFLLVSPERLLVGLEKRWGTFRRGTELRVHRQDPGEVELRLATPPFLHTALAAQSMATALHAAIERAGAKRAQVTGDVLSSTEVAYKLSWA